MVLVYVPREEIFSSTPNKLCEDTLPRNLNWGVHLLIVYQDDSLKTKQKSLCYVFVGGLYVNLCTVTVIELILKCVQYGYVQTPRQTQ